VVDHAPFGHWRTQTFIGALRRDRMDAPWVIDGAINGEMFDRYVTTQLAPTLRAGDVVILDNLSSHKKPSAARTLREIGASFLFCRPTVPICTQLKWRSRNSRRSSGKLRLEHMKISGKWSGAFAPCSQTRNAITSSDQRVMGPIKCNLLYSILEVVANLEADRNCGVVFEFRTRSITRLSKRISQYDVADAA